MTFPHERFNSLVEETFENVRKLIHFKGGEYSGDIDRLANFRRNADQADTTMEFIWRVYASKHWDAICQYERDVRTATDRLRLETVESRVDDLITYLLLFKAMLYERDEADKLRAFDDVFAEVSQEKH